MRLFCLCKSAWRSIKYGAWRYGVISVQRVYDVDLSSVSSFPERNREQRWRIRGSQSQNIMTNLSTHRFPSNATHEKEGAKDGGTERGKDRKRNEKEKVSEQLFLVRTFSLLF